MNVRIIDSHAFIIIAMSILLFSCRPDDLETTATLSTRGQITVAAEVAEEDNMVRVTPTHMAETHAVQTSEPVPMETPSATAATITSTSIGASDIGLSFLAELPPDSDKRSPQPSHVRLTFLLNNLLKQIDGIDGSAAHVAIATMRPLGIVVNQPSVQVRL